jgi:hypothetical protein
MNRYIQILCHFLKGLEHLKILQSAGAPRTNLLWIQGQLYKN